MFMGTYGSQGKLLICLFNGEKQLTVAPCQMLSEEWGGVLFSRKHKMAFSHIASKQFVEWYKENRLLHKLFNLCIA